MEEASGALEAYFTGMPPLKEPKVRKDIPDAFIYQNLQQLYHNNNEQLAVVVEDRGLSDACKACGMEVYPSLSDFLSSAEVQEFLVDGIVHENLIVVLNRVQQFADEHEQEIVNAIENKMLQADSSMIYGEGLPGETNEIYVSGAAPPNNVEVAVFEHLGAGLFLAQFSGEIELVYEYAMEIFESMDLDRDKFFVEPLNDHYVNVESTDVFEFSGRIELDFGEGILGTASIEDLMAALIDPTISVDELGEFQIVVEDS